MSKWCTSFIFLFLVFAPHLDAQAHKSTLIVGYLPATHDELLFIAKDKSFFDQENLDVQLLQFRNSPEILQALIAQKVDVGIPGIAAPVMYISNGAPLHIIGGAAKNSAAVVVPASSAGLFRNLGPEEKIKRFKGLRVGTVKQSTGDAIFRYATRKAGIAQDVDIREFQSPVEVLTALKSETIDAAVLWSPHMSKAEAEGMPIVLWMSEVMPGHEHVCCRQVVHDSYLRDHRPELVGYMRALIKAMLFYQDPANETEVVRISQKYVPGMSEEVLKKELLPPAARTSVSVDISEEGILAYVGAMEDSGELNKDQANMAMSKIDSSIMRDAYLSLGVAPNQVSKCLRSGLIACPLQNKRYAK